MRYYSQAKQDYLLDRFVFRGRRGGIFVDVGANDGITLSNSYFFEKNRGWRGLCVEADTTLAGDLSNNRPNSTCINVAAGRGPGEMDFIEISGPCQMLSGFASSADRERIDREIQQHGGSQRVVKVPVRPLASVLEANHLAEVHYLSVDVEGAEPEVLAGLDFEATLVHVLTVECNTPAAERRIVTQLEGFGFINCGRLEADLFFINRRSEYARSTAAIAEILSIERARRPTLWRRAVGRISRMMRHSSS